VCTRGGNDQKSLATFARVLYIVDYQGLTLPAPARLLGGTPLDILPFPSHLRRLVEGGMGHSIYINPPRCVLSLVWKSSEQKKKYFFFFFCKLTNYCYVILFTMLFCSFFLLSKRMKTFKLKKCTISKKLLIHIYFATPSCLNSVK
jgi:hypothetical protein